MLTFPNLVYRMSTKVLKVPTQKLTCMSERVLVGLHPSCNGWQKTPLLSHLKQAFSAAKIDNPPLSRTSAAGRGEPSLVSAFFKLPDRGRVGGDPAMALGNTLY